MALAEVPDLQDYLRVLPVIERSPDAAVRFTYDREADVMYVNFRKPSIATDSELTDDDIIIRYDDDDEIIGFTILHAGQRQ